LNDVNIDDDITSGDRLLICSTFLSLQWGMVDLSRVDGTASVEVDDERRRRCPGRLVTGCNVIM